ncbi:hypothetical protein ABTX15_06325 [Micromonospora sp. NPDC094482]|uniref:helix-turn-helix transcriptional regulator n=1 Tax=unclassified Micromonospora TaxID=2617518 RepID=UPI003320C086
MSTHLNPTEKTSEAAIERAASTLPGEVWTVDRVRALGVTTTLATAASILGVSRSQAYRLAATDAFPAPLIRAGNRIIVPVAGLLQLLLLDSPAPTNGGRRLDPDVKVSVDATTPPPADSTRHRWRHQTKHPGDDE